MWKSRVVCLMRESLSAGLEQIPSGLLAKLESLDRPELDLVAARWAETMSTADHTHSVSGEKLSDGWTLSDALEVLVPIRELAQQATREQQMYLLWES